MKMLNTTRRRTLLLLIGLLGALLIGVACSSGEPAAAPTPTAQPTEPAGATTTPASAPAQPVTVKIQDNTFDSLWIENAIAKFIVEKGYGHKVEEVVLNTVAGQTAIQRGDIDLNLELWPTNIKQWWDEQTAKGNVVKLGNIYEGGDQFWVIPKWVAEQHNIKTVEDMKRPEVVKLFQDPENPKKGVFYNCIFGWQCEQINHTKFKAYGLDQYYNVVSPGSGAALDAAMVGAMKKKQPVFGYYWAPTSIYGAYEWHILEEAAYTRECGDEMEKGAKDRSYIPKVVCGYETEPVVVAASKRFVQEGPPELIEFFKKMNVGRVQVSQTAAWAVENDIQGRWEKAAVYYLKTFEERWKTWVPDTIYEKVRAAVAQAG